MASETARISEAAVATNVTSAAEVRAARAGEIEIVFYRCKSKQMAQRNDVQISLEGKDAYYIIRKRIAQKSFTSSLRKELREIGLGGHTIGKG